MSKTNVMGFSRLEMAAIKRCYQNVKPIYRKIDKLTERVKSEEEEKEALIKEALANDEYAQKMSERVTGFSLTSREILDYAENPEKWQEFLNKEKAPEGETAGAKDNAEPVNSTADDEAMLQSPTKPEVPQDTAFGE